VAASSLDEPVDDTAHLIDPAPSTFFGVPSLGDLATLNAQVAFLGVPYDGGTPEPGIPTGQRAAPAAVRDATTSPFHYPRSAGAGDDPGAGGWYDVEADRDYLVGVTMADVPLLADGDRGTRTFEDYLRSRTGADGAIQDPYRSLEQEQSSLCRIQPDPHTPKGR
jgi:hypothetical protein